MCSHEALDLYISTTGNDGNAGTFHRPFATLHKAQRSALDLLRSSSHPVRVLVRAGTYYLDQPLVFGPDDTGTGPNTLHFAAYGDDRVTLSGGRRLHCDWQVYRDGIYACAVPRGLHFTQLFVNGKRQIRARFPNADPSDPRRFSGYLRAAGPVGDHEVDPMPGPNDDMTFSSGAPRGIRYTPATWTARDWTRPSDAVIHIFQAHGWGNLQWRVKCLDAEHNTIWFGDGGQQIGAKWHAAPCAVDERSHFFVENVLEELDAPGEWYLDEQQARLLYLPPADVDLDSALVEVPVLQQVVRIVGSSAQPATGITLEGFRFAHTASTFLEPYAVPSLSDWSIHRGGAVFLDGTRDCAIKDCFFDAVGGNAVFANNYNRNLLVSGCRFAEAGDSAICFVGSLETTVGTQRHFPFACRAENNLIHDCGVFGKQVAGVYISRAKRITAAHNLIFRMPRAGICIGDGTWGGHVIEYNHIHDTCRETGDHGPFNAWGRDRYWCLVQSHTQLSGAESHAAGHVAIDALEPVVVRHNHFAERSGWGLDLDDGASCYDIYNNLCVGVSIKLREGAYRTIRNNIWVNGANSPCFHVGNADNHDRYVNNITVMSVASRQPEMDLDFEMGATYGEVYTLIGPPAQAPWLQQCDYNCFWSDLGTFVARVRQRGDQHGHKLTLDEWRALGYDRHSVFADPRFVDPANGDYRVRPDSPALALGFENFVMDDVGLTDAFPQRWSDKR